MLVYEKKITIAITWKSQHVEVAKFDLVLLKVALITYSLFFSRQPTSSNSRSKGCGISSNTL